MFFRQIIDPLLSQHAYLVGCESVKEAVLFEPERDIERYFRLAEKNGYRIVAAAETHIHADYLSGLRQVAERGVKVYASDEGDKDWKYEWLKNGNYDSQLLRHGDSFKIGRITFRVIHTPGHTPEHICFEIAENVDGQERYHGVLTGDFVFVGDVGRPDLLESAAGIIGSAEIAAGQLYESVQKFKRWSTDLMIWPSHGAGSACGKSLGTSPLSTVEEEIKYNRSVQAANGKREFVEYIISGQPEPPYYFARMKKENKTGPAILSRETEIKRLTWEELLKISSDKNSLVLDGRSWEDFRRGHLTGSLFAPLDKYFILVCGSYIEAGTEIAVICDEDVLEPTLSALSRVGHDKLIGYIGSEEFEKNKKNLGAFETIDEISVGELRKVQKESRVYILDVRNSQELIETGQVEGAGNIAFTRLLPEKSQIPRDKLIHVYCRSGNRSSYACSYLKNSGFAAVHVAGGIVAWLGSGFSVVSSGQK
jgi:hydroxyacylglutathione hydrolase